MSLVERLQSVLVALAAGLGLGLGLALPVQEVAGALVLPLLLMMLVAVFVQLEVAQVREAGSARRVLLASLALNFLVTPALAWALGAGLLADQPDLRIGLLLLLVTPCTDWYLVFTALARGHGGIAAALLPVNLVLQLALLPVYVVLLGGRAATVDAATLVRAVLLVLLVPLAVALLLRWASGRAPGGRVRDEVLLPVASRAVVPLLCAAVAAMFASQARLVVEDLGRAVSLLAPLLAFFVVLPLLGVAVARALSLPADQRATLVMVTTARNSPLALAVAVAAFPDRPLIAVALVLGPLLELPVLALLAQVVRVREQPVRG